MQILPVQAGLCKDLTSVPTQATMVLSMAPIKQRKQMHSDI